MPWQQQVADVGGELLEDGRPAYRHVVVTVNRQSGKTTLIFSWEIQRAVGWSHLGPQRIAYSAQTGLDARRKFTEDQFPLLEPKLSTFGIKQLYRRSGEEGVIFDNGSRIGLLSNTDRAGHGRTVDLAIKDEFFSDTDDRRDQALIPSMMARPYAQIITASTMGTDESAPLNQLVDTGRQATLASINEGIAYFEWSADPDDDPDDPEVWRRCMPALGYTLTEDVVRHARQTLSLPEFWRAFLNVKNGRKANHIIPLDRWQACADTSSRPVGSVALAFDISPDRQSGALAIAGNSSTSGLHIEVTDHRKGTGWMVERIAEIAARNDISSIVCDPVSPANSLLADLEAKGLTIRKVTTREATASCGALYDAVLNGKLKHIDQPSLNAAVDGVDKRTVNDAWMWSRKSSNVDISPLVACTLARFAHCTEVPLSPISMDHLGIW